VLYVIMVPINIYTEEKDCALVDT